MEYRRGSIFAGARGGTRTPTPERTTDFKSVASTIPPHGHLYENEFNIKRAYVQIKTI